MKIILLILFVVAGQIEGPYTWSREDTRQPFVYETEAECSAVVEENGEGWIAEEKAAHQTDDVKLFYECHVTEPGQPV